MDTALQHQRDLQDLDLIAATPPNYALGAISGATTAWTIGFLLDGYRHKDWKRLLKYGVIGAGISIGFQMLARKGAVGLASWGRSHADLWNVPVPATPVVTKGHFAGMPRHLHPTEDDYYRHLDRSHDEHHHVGAPPPGGDYSFTRRPGYNSKDY